ncbi:glycoside hydrolase family 78 protein [Paenibacillus sp. OAS669]|uniref:glycoside hydrolase family 78 protein n=1 Tax=Paenibacillus sp. OAS669 TaxID=2663821 RepID=UPI0017890005|nr:glycoside hydrolase family 78 protein [Paenibacillus sp. OAS669]MBE1441938.1 alpha-L-rhamnosidase [Paenibacillus sp. OAS669]
MRICGLKTEYTENPLGLDTMEPRLSWVMESEAYGQLQTAYQVLVATSIDQLEEDKSDVWDSGKVVSDQSVNVVYQGKTLASQQVYYWKVRVWDRDGNVSPWSEIARWSMGVLRGDEWQAKWIGRSKPQTYELLPSPYFRRTFRLDKPVRQALVYASALGLYELYVNGERVSGDYFAPGWTDYRIRVQYQTYDVTAYLQKGESVLAAIAGTGWYCGHVGMFGPNRYGDNPHVLIELHVEYEDGTSQRIVTDEAWKTFASPIVYSDLLKGETYDARLEPKGWKLPGFDDSGWEAPVVLTAYSGVLNAQVDPPVQVMKELLPVSMKKTDRGTYLFDMGQNMVGWVRLRIEDGQEGQQVTVACAEMLNSDNTLYSINLREAVQQENYILDGQEEVVLEPHFTFHGFRYVEVSGLTHATLNTVIGRVVHSATPQTGWLQTSNVMLNKLLSNIEWGQRGNFISVPTDCPQRDERLGWTGDAQIFARTASYNMDVGRFFNKYMIDVIDAQHPSGAFPDVAPDGGWEEFKHNNKELNWHAPDNGGWGDAGVIIPWTVYQVYGDLRILERCYPAMVKWVEYLKEKSSGLIREGYSNYGDWLSVNADTPKDVLDTAYFAYSTSLLAKAAKALGNDEDERKYNELFEAIKRAFGAAFVKEDGRIKGDTQTVYVLALKMNLLTESQRKLAIEHLVSNIREHDLHLTTGFLGVGYLLPALTEMGREDIAYSLLTQDTFPSWLYSVKHGATTIWERWDAWTETDGFQNPGMNSFNHYSLGSVGEWMYQTILGINAVEEQPGYKHILIHPRPGGGLQSAKGEFKSVYGTIRVEWKQEMSYFLLKVRIPVNTTATIHVPGTILIDGQRESQGVLRLVKTNNHETIYEAGSGSYTFISRRIKTNADSGLSVSYQAGS